MSTRDGCSGEMMDTIEYEKRLYNEHSGEQIKRYSGKASKIVNDYWDSKLVSMLDLSGNDLVLDCGCGVGMIANKISSIHPVNVVGIDLSQSLIKIARRESKAFFVVGDAENLPFKDRTFDRIVGKGILHHLHKPEKGVHELRRVLKKKGKFVVSEPNRSNPLIGLTRFFLKKLKHSYSEKQVYFSPADIRELIPNSKLTYFGYFAYPLGFADILHVPLPSCAVKFLIQIDELLSRIPIINMFSWNIIAEIEYQ